MSYLIKGRTGLMKVPVWLIEESRSEQSQFQEERKKERKKERRKGGKEESLQSQEEDTMD